MACTECKKKRDIKKEMSDSTKSVEKRIVYFVIIWSLFGIYGVYSFIRLFI